MRFHQVRELVSWATNFHSRMAEQYRQLATTTESERQRMALEYLAQREDKQHTELTRYATENGDHRAVLDTWFDDPTDFPHPLVVERLPGRTGNGEIQDVMATALTAHRTLQDLYTHRAERAAGARELAFFQSLADGHEAEVRHIVRDLQQLDAY
ncbi:2-hydroxyacyl-CoA dehydratase [Halomonas sp. ML-15]|uniref:2-hydroxyacyl-CoA dehydratase n=1 Tax=Halomonas sp. ML-15 TaxID=2773305 RepID=UPI0017469DF3|nr:2-hydroxyacyl-CoA dehydratase [Halomonas sp. ML-15]MBD3897609.1 2-hydroxyacyl-CoA dehydratase [Halomonas sp. ML-15]